MSVATVGVLEREEVAQDAQTGLTALFGMELRAEDVTRPQRCRDAATVIVAIGKPIAIVGRLRRKGVHEIAGAARCYAFENSTFPVGVAVRLVERTPTDVRNLVRRAVATRARNRAHTPRHDTKPLVLAELLTNLHQHLHADADAEHRRSAADIVHDGLDQIALTQLAHAVAKRAHAGNHETLCAGDPSGISG